MATTTESNPKLAKLLIPTGHWRFVTDAEHGPAIAALAKVVGAREAKFPSLQRRLAVRADGSEFLLTFNDCLHRDPNNISWDVGSPPTQSFPTALPIAEAVELLNSEASPEKELARRVALADARIHTPEHVDVPERLPDVLGQHHGPAGGLPACELSGRAAHR